MDRSPIIITRAFRCAICGLYTWLCLTGFVARSQSRFSPLLSLEMNSGAPALKYSLPQAANPYLIMSSPDLDELRWGYLLRVIPGDRGATGQIGLSLSFLTNSRAFFSVDQATGFTSAPPGFLWVPSGTFMMGSPLNEGARDPDEIQTEVTITDGFWVNRHEVTQGEFVQVMGFNPSRFTNASTGSQLPVESVTWEDSMAYAARLTEIFLASGTLPEGYVVRLPTEAEWEFACRAGSTTAFAFGPGLDHTLANFLWSWEYTPESPWMGTDVEPLDHTTTVESFPPNSFGLHDMHGNVWEWCLDWVQGNLPGGSITNPLGKLRHSINPKKIVRGGSFEREPNHSRSANRSTQFPYWTNYVDFEGNSISTGPNYTYGFRVVIGRPIDVTP